MWGISILLCHPRVHVNLVALEPQPEVSLCVMWGLLFATWSSHIPIEVPNSATMFDLPSLLPYEDRKQRAELCVDDKGLILAQGRLDRSLWTIGGAIAFCLIPLGTELEYTIEISPMPSDVLSKWWMPCERQRVKRSNQSVHMLHSP